MSPIFPLSLKIADRLCVVVGGGEVAAQKVDSLLVCGGRVTVISPSLHAALSAKESAGVFRHIARDYQPGDIAGAFLVVVATDDGELNRAVCEEARARGILVNVVDAPELCDFYYPSIVRRGHLTVSIASDGIAPALSKALREQLEAELDDGYLDLLELLVEVRGEVKAQFASFAARRRAWERIVGVRQELLELLRTGRRDEARERVRACIW